MKMHLINILLLIFLLNVNCLGQIMQGKITYERKTNLIKRFDKSEWIENYTNKTGKIQSDVFELYFNDTAFTFVFPETDEVVRGDWMTSKNKTAIYYTQNCSYKVVKLWGEEITMKDSIPQITWKITDSKRLINGLNCRKAIWQKNDSTKIYAWYSEEINANVGPEGLNGLPGAILGLAKEKGDVVYFATKIEAFKPIAEKLIITKKTKNIPNAKELRIDLENRYKNEPWGKNMINNIFKIM